MNINFISIISQSHNVMSRKNAENKIIQFQNFSPETVEIYTKHDFHTSNKKIYISFLFIRNANQENIKLKRFFNALRGLLNIIENNSKTHIPSDISRKSIPVFLQTSAYHARKKISMKLI